MSRESHAGLFMQGHRQTPSHLTQMSDSLGLRGDGPGTACQQALKRPDLPKQGHYFGAKKPEKGSMEWKVRLVQQREWPEPVKVWAGQGASESWTAGQTDPRPPPPGLWVTPCFWVCSSVSCYGLSPHAEWLRNNDLQWLSFINRTFTVKIIGNSQSSAWAYFRCAAYTSEVPDTLSTASLGILFEADFFGSLSGNLPRGGLRGTRNGGLVQMLLGRAADSHLTAPPAPSSVPSS